MSSSLFWMLLVLLNPLLTTNSNQSDVCPVYDPNYLTFNDTNVFSLANNSILTENDININDYVTYIPMVNPSIINTTRAVHYTGWTFNCSDNIIINEIIPSQDLINLNGINGCYIHCKDRLGCLVSTLYCDSSIGCNIRCDEERSCNQMNVISNKYQNSLIITCSGENSCDALVLNVHNIKKVEIHCIGQLSCMNLNATLNEISSYNNTNTSISCYTENACDYINIYADGPYTKLNMFSYSTGVELHNNFGYFNDYVNSESFTNIECGLNQNYIQYQIGDDIKTLVENQYPSSLPCSHIHIICGSNVSCNMTYEYKHIDPTYPAFEDAECLYVKMSDVIILKCNGECQNSPTISPTPTPTNVPSVPPSIAPTFLPSNIPTSSPSMTPTFTPTNIPSLSPTIFPSESPFYFLSTLSFMESSLSFQTSIQITSTQTMDTTMSIAPNTDENEMISTNDIIVAVCIGIGFACLAVIVYVIWKKKNTFKVRGTKTNEIEMENTTELNTNSNNYIPAMITTDKHTNNQATTPEAALLI